MPNGFVHIELNTGDVTKAKKFYKGIFDWNIGPMAPGYLMIDVGKNGTGGGMQTKAIPGSPTMWLPYVAVEDVKKTVAKAKKLGAKIMVDYMEIGDMGAIGVFIDPTGAAIGVWEGVKTAPRKPAKKSAKKAAKKGAKGKK
jgi:hypothetical protein